MSQVGQWVTDGKSPRRVAAIVLLVFALVAGGIIIANQVDPEVSVATATRNPEAVRSEAAGPDSDEVLGIAVISTDAGPAPTPVTAGPTTQVLPPTAGPTTGPTATAEPEPTPVLPPAPELPPPIAVPATSTPTPTPTVESAPEVLASAATSIAPTQPTAIVAPTAAPTRGPAIAVSPSVNRSGPPSVVNQIPDAAFRWLDAYGWSVSWRQGPGPGRVSEAQYATKTIVIWYDTTHTDRTWAGAFAHELGHAVSFTHFSSDQMNEWNAMRGTSSWRWVPGTTTDFGVGEGDFAEAFMSYLLGHQVRSVGGPINAQVRAWIAANTPF